MLRNTAEDRVDLVFDALGNPVRREILRRLGGGAMSVAELASAFTISRPAVSRHLSLLEDAGLVTHAGAGTKTLYALDQAGFGVSRAWLDRFWDDAEARLRLVAMNLPEATDE